MNISKTTFLPGVLITVALTICAPCQADATTQSISFKSTALDKVTTYIAAVPSPMIPDHKYPVLYLLHGAYSNYKEWSELTTITQQLNGRDMIIIMPDGSPFGWYLDSKIKTENQYDTAITRDLREDVEKRFPVIKNRDGRAICGLSMGGHGALSLAAKHPDLYGSASSLSGIVDILAHPGKWHLDEILGKLPGAMDEWKKNSVVYLADAFTTGNVAILFDCGDNDATGATIDNKHLDQELNRLKIEHTYREFPGRHNWDYWRAHISEHLDFHQQQFEKAEKEQTTKP